MIDPHIKPKKDISPATKLTAHMNAGVLAAECCEGYAVSTELKDKYGHEVFLAAMRGDEMLQNFMNSRKR